MFLFSFNRLILGFLKFVVTPLVSEWHDFLNNDLTAEMMMNLKINQSKWDALVKQENEEEGETEISEAEGIDEEACSNGSSDSVDPLLPKIKTPEEPKCDELRRYSVPANLESTSGENIKNTRRDSYHFEEKPSPFKISLADDEKLSFKDSMFLFHSSLSLNRIMDENRADNLMIAETLLPEHSIATITNVEEANRINIVVHGNVPQKTLVRQLTYPPIQPFSRVRYFSTAEEAAFGVEPVAEGSAQSTSSQCSQSDSPTSPSSVPDGADVEKSDDTKPEESTGLDVDKPEEGNKFEKENCDPKVANLNFNRRSSAPTTSDNVNDIPRLDERRCSVPIESHSNGIYDHKRLMFSFISKHI